MEDIVSPMVLNGSYTSRADFLAIYRCSGQGSYVSRRKERLGSKPTVGSTDYDSGGPARTRAPQDPLKEVRILSSCNATLLQAICTARRSAAVSCDPVATRWRI